MRNHRVQVWALVAGVIAFAPVAGAAQPLGTYAWQLQPFCNRISVNVVQAGAVYTLDGWDDQCGASVRAPVTGSAVLNPNGTIGLGLTIVTTPGGVPVHVDAAVTLPSASGNWRDSNGNTGNFVLGGPGGGGPRPAGGVVTGVTAGAGLVGVGTGGNITLSVSFAGSGSASTAARSDHRHDVGGANTVIGDLALASITTGNNNTAGGWSAMAATTSGYQNTATGASALRWNTTGHSNTAAGAQALFANTTGDRNTALGSYALRFNTEGYSNTATGDAALQLNLTGINNVAVGASALAVNTTGDANTALGDAALPLATTADNNIAIGAGSGGGLVTGAGNIYVQADAAAPDESSTLRIGSALARAFIGGIRSVTTGAADAVPVVIDSNGQLGTVSSSRRTKDHIADLDGLSHAVLRLRPVQFTYRQAFADGTTPVQYGLIAEEVDAVMPGLVAYGADGQPETVKYHVLPTLLLAEVQRLERERARQDALLAAQAADLAALRDLVLTLERQVSARAAEASVPGTRTPGPVR